MQITAQSLLDKPEDSLPETNTLAYFSLFFIISTLLRVRDRTLVVRVDHFATVKYISASIKTVHVWGKWHFSILFYCFDFSLSLLLVIRLTCGSVLWLGRHDIQSSVTQHNDTQNNAKKCDTQHDHIIIIAIFSFRCVSCGIRTPKPKMVREWCTTVPPYHCANSGLYYKSILIVIWWLSWVTFVL